MPSLKFWSSPASVIESYLQRKVFQRRLQLAYEFNQSKDPGLNDTEDSAKEAQKHLTQALVQLTSDMNYFQHLASQQVLRQAQQREVEVVQNSYEFQNKTNWERICPEKEVTNDDDSLPEAEVMMTVIQHQERLSRDIKNRYINYKDFYKLQNISQRDKEPLAITINQQQQKSASTSDDSPGVHSVCFNDDNFPIKFNEVMTSNPTKKVTLTNAFGHTSYKSNRPGSFGTLPRVKYSSIDSYCDEMDFNRIIFQNSELGKEMQDEEALFPPLTTNSMVLDNISRKGTVRGTMRDSFELNQKRMPSINNKTVMARKNNKSFSSFISHRDSYMMVASKRLDKLKSDQSPSLSYLSQYSSYPNKNKKNSSFSADTPFSLADHRNSIELTTDKKLFKRKSNKPVTCDICNNDYTKPVQFICNLHSEMCSLRPVSNERFSIVSSRKSDFRHKDSLEVIPKMLSSKGNSISVQTQAKDVEILKDTLPTSIMDIPPLQLVSVVKGSQKSKKLDKPIEQGHINLTPSKLNLYLMKSINVNQIVLDDNNKPQM